VIEPEDLTVPDVPIRRSEFAISESGAVNHSTPHSIAINLMALESKPVIGAFDANHLQQIHAHIFQEVLPLAGQLRERRPSSLSSSLDTLFDRLARENRLKGLELDAWSKRVTHYRHEIERINPFHEGSDIASAEFLRELAMENGITLRWTTALVQSSEAELQMRTQKLQSENLRRLLILAVDPDLSKRKSFQDRDRHESMDLFAIP
jgi:fido (protein-threonine AMPylation protein)